MGPPYCSACTVKAKRSQKHTDFLQIKASFPRLMLTLSEKLQYANTSLPEISTYKKARVFLMKLQRNGASKWIPVNNKIRA